MKGTMDVAQKAKEFETKTAQELLRWAFDVFGDRVALASSFGVEDVALIDVMVSINPKARIFTLDQGQQGGWLPGCRKFSVGIRLIEDLHTHQFAVKGEQFGQIPHLVFDMRDVSRGVNFECHFPTSKICEMIDCFVALSGSSQLREA